MDWIITEQSDIGQRLDKHLTGRLTDLSRSRLQDLIRDGHVTLNGRPAKASISLKPGDAISLIIPEATAVAVVAQDIPLEILFEDKDILVLNKPPGLVVHPAAGNPDGTLVNALLHHCDDLSGIGGEMRPGIVHRLDKDTSGCMVVAKNDIAHRRLSEAFAERRMSKIYLAAINGVPKEKSGRIQNLIGRHPVDRKRMATLYDGAGKEAVTEWEQLSVYKECALIRCKLLTGRTHQIRVHMKEGLGSPILGDPIYGHPSRQKIPSSRLMLHAWKLSLNHPVHDQPMSFEAAVPVEYGPWMCK
ncbi:23S rRNA pseudouridine1911/1915/1917 synthase [Prosthecobacter fusiformis]|uniref:Pseudouridine synthase n=1 Tax=Prosthecobacter fusiformis TaxID=48464 RepID=A0A4R7RLT4_9BACT|nr:RluA family pseudouridine synthase [Prosthecobacter fusiformis]TDU64625.1 23S rRNA pseudouridine1911/1915/1917 synthase [Prosthecobacter fusiformis]